MISVVLYGRNDSYGYNLQKRAVLSLNCIAEMLDSPDDEILFVDYNTPDDLPTFPESIADLLIPRARQLLRTLRVRPSLHNRYFGGRTHLRALEPVSRNAAIRRANPNNRWILSTNTDMIFVPRGPFEGQSLSRIAASLPDGFYHAPRMELPEGLWETLDRMAPRNVIETVRRWGTQLRINEVVHGNAMILFDGPGDFQLMLRDDLFAIDGFDERMIFGWHVDSNIAKRLFLHRGGICSAKDFVFGYHCDHTRESSPLHRHDRQQNSLTEFYENVVQSRLPQQAQTWGFSAEELEEIRIPPDLRSRFVEAIEKIVEPLSDRGYIEAALRDDTHNDLRYDVDHVAPFIANNFVTMPPNSTLAYYGARRQTFATVRRIWNELGIGGTIYLTYDVAALLGVKSSYDVAVVAEDRALRDADVFVFDFGRPSDDGALPPPGEHYTMLPGQFTGQDSVKLLQVYNALERAAGTEPHVRGNKEPRRFIVTNTQNTIFEPPTMQRLQLTFTPYSSGVRHGYAYTNIGRSSEDLAVAENDTNRFSSIVSVPVVHSFDIGRSRSLSRLLSVDDWEDPEWYRWADATLLRRMAKRRDWSRSMWETAHTFYALSRLGMLRGDVSVVALTAERTDYTVEMMRPWVKSAVIAEVSQLVNQALTLESSFNVVIVTRSAVESFGMANMPRLLECASRLLHPGGVCIVLGDFVLAGERRQTSFDTPLLDAGVMSTLIDDHGVLVLEGPLDLSLSSHTLQRLVLATEASTNNHCVVSDENVRQRTSIAFAYRKVGTDTVDSWDRVRSSFLEALGDTSQQLDLPALGAIFTPPVPALRARHGWKAGDSDRVEADERPIRQAIWDAYTRFYGQVQPPIIVPFYYGLRLAVRCGNDVSFCAYVSGLYEPNKFNWLAGRLKPGMIVLDVGANEGLYTCFAARRIGSRGRVIALETGHRESTSLNENISLNALQNVTTLQIALGASDDVALSREAKSVHSGLHAINRGSEPSSLHMTTGSIMVRTLDSIVQELDLTRVDFIKINVEAHEPSIIDGAIATLRKFQPTLMLELFPNALRARRIFVENLYRNLENVGYELHAFDSGTGLTSRILQVGDDDVTLLAIPSTRRAQFGRHLAALAEDALAVPLLL